MNITEAIRTHAAVEAAAKDWAGVAAKLRAIVQTSEPRKCGSRESAFAVVNAGGDHKTLLRLLRQDDTGELLYQRLCDGSSEGGVMWAEPLLTIPYLRSREADFGKPVIDALIELSAPTVRPFAEVTAEQCSAAWLVGADCLLSVNRTNGVLRVSLNVQRDGQQIRLALLTEGQGSAADQALTSAIETAIDAWLQAGG